MGKPTQLVVLVALVALAAGLWLVRVVATPTPPAPKPKWQPAPLVVPDFDSDTQARTAEDVQRLRAQLIADVFGGKLPTGRELARASIIPSDRPTRSLAIYHSGHMQIAERSGTVQALREAGYDVLAISMPEGDHGRFAGEAYPLRPFLEPVALGLNHALSLKDYDEVIMAGLSGGGWTTVLYAAMDPRIQRSYPIAGSVPEYLRQVIPKSAGDFEQTLPGISVGYLDIYLLAASEGREQFQVFNRHDPCCFSGDLVHTYRPFVEQRAAELGGRFGLVVDEFDRHDLSPTMAHLLWGRN